MRVRVCVCVGWGGVGGAGWVGVGVGARVSFMFVGSGWVGVGQYVRVGVKDWEGFRAWRPEGQATTTPSPKLRVNHSVPHERPLPPSLPLHLPATLSATMATPARPRPPRLVSAPRRSQAAAARRPRPRAAHHTGHSGGREPRAAGRVGWGGVGGMR